MFVRTKSAVNDEHIVAALVSVEVLADLVSKYPDSVTW